MYPAYSSRFRLGSRHSDVGQPRFPGPVDEKRPMMTGPDNPPLTAKGLPMCCLGSRPSRAPEVALGETWVDLPEVSGSVANR